MCLLRAQQSHRSSTHCFNRKRFMIIGATLLALMLTTLLILVLRKHAVSLSLMDHPGVNKTHALPTPAIGGIAIAIGCSISWLMIYSGPMQMELLILVATLVLLVGLLDDIRSLSSISRFVIYVIVLLIGIYILDIRIINLGSLVDSQEVLLTSWSIPFTIFAIIGVINAINMTDGVDGLSGTLVLIALLSLLALVLLQHQAGLGVIIASLIGSVIAFLAFNIRIPGRKYATIYMGDSGSTWLGFVLAVILVRYSQEPERLFPPVLALWMIALPLYDTVGMLLRRPLRGRSPFKADRTHTHHILLSLGFSVNQVVLFISVLQAMLVFAAIVAVRNGIHDYILFGFFLAGFVVYLVLMVLVERKLEDRNTRVTS